MAHEELLTNIAIKSGRIESDVDVYELRDSMNFVENDED